MQDTGCSWSFNPLHCGAVVASAPGGAGAAGASRAFQSPSLRGSGRFLGMRCTLRRPPRMFQSPSLRGSGRFRLLAWGRDMRIGAVLIPFIAGQWSLLMYRRQGLKLFPVSIPFIAGQWSLRPLAVWRGARREKSFNPLHCGAVVASRRMAGAGRRGEKVSIPFIAGQWSLRRRCAGACPAPAQVSIPFIAGQWSLPPFWR